MPNLDVEARRRVWAYLMRQRQVAMGATGMTKEDFRLAVDATDDWIQANEASFNSAIPQPARGAMSNVQKTLMFCYVAMRRAGILKGDDD